MAMTQKETAETGGAPSDSLTHITMSATVSRTVMRWAALAHELLAQHDTICSVGPERQHDRSGRPHRVVEFIAPGGIRGRIACFSGIHPYRCTLKIDSTDVTEPWMRKMGTPCFGRLLSLIDSHKPTQKHRYFENVE